MSNLPLIEIVCGQAIIILGAVVKLISDIAALHMRVDGRLTELLESTRAARDGNRLGERAG